MSEEERCTYQPLFQALEPGMAVAFNRSLPGGSGTQELEVESVTAAGDVYLKRGHNDRLRAWHDNQRGMVFHPLDDDGYQAPGKPTEVTTLEVIGLA